MGAVAVLVTGMLTPAAWAAAGPGTVGPTRAPVSDGPVGRDVGTFRVDVSRFPQIGVVVTVPGPVESLHRSDFLVLSGREAQVPSIRRLSADDIEVMLAPGADGAPARLYPQWAAAARFLAGLPAGARTGIADPSGAALVASPLSMDPARSVTDVANLAPAPGPVPAAARLAASLSAFSRGSRVRRTVVLAISRNEPLSRAAAARFRQQLAASGTALYVLDAAPRAALGYDALAAGSGGSAIRIRRTADWPLAFGQITDDLNRQYYLTFSSRARLPGHAVIVVRTAAGVVQGIADLPATNPVAPPPIRVLVPVLPRSWDSPFVWMAALLIVLGVGYGLGMLTVSRREPRRRGRRRLGAGAAAPVPTNGLFFVFLMPCLNEEKVLPNSLQRLLSIPGDNFVIMVIDDGSDDHTVEAISGLLGERVWLLSRKPPNARQGKGEALNAAIRYLTSSGLLEGYAADDVITVVVDADGRLDQDAIAEVSPYFADPTVGAVQIGVRINNRDSSRLARMQDIEFVVYTEVFQRGRRHLGSVGLGGNGQFVRLSALLSLAGEPWTRSLTDDLDLGVRLIASGWHNEYCPRVAVHQQGVVELRRLIRQRSRWFQGHLQSWRLVPLVLRRVPRRARTDLYYHLTSPAILLIASLLSASFVVSLVDCVVLAAQGHNPFGWWIASTYALTFGPALVYGCVYWQRERVEGVSYLRVAWFAHLYVCYGMMWYASGWWAVARTLRGRTGWAKTDRVTEAPAVEPVSAPAGNLATGGGLLVPLPPPDGSVAMAPVRTARPPSRPGPVVATPGDGQAGDLSGTIALPVVSAVPVAPPGGLLAEDLAATMPLPVVSAAPVAPPVGAVTEDLTATIPLPVVSVQAPGQPASPGAVVPGAVAAGSVIPGPDAGSRPSPTQSVSGPSADTAPRPRRIRRRVAIMAAAAACAALATFLAWPGVLGGGGGGHEWLTAFNGYGQASVAGSGPAAVISLAPAPARTRDVTHSALVVSTRWYGDFAVTLRVRTLRQLRHGPAGQPHPWEVAWVVWHYSSNQRFYALTLEAGGWVLSKQDPGYPGGERFLASAPTPRFPIGTWHSVGIVQVGNQIDVSADGQLLTRFTDTQQPYLNGALGAYSEDSAAQFDHIRLHALTSS